MTELWFKKLLKDMWIALRPLSLTLAFASTSTGILVAYKEGFIATNRVTYESWLILLITVAGLAAQAGANLINDYFEGSFRYHRSDPQTIKFLGKMRSKFDILIFAWGLGCFALAGLIGLYLVYSTNYQMFIIGFVGILGAYAYTGEPFVYKRRGLGVPLSFILMGPLMVYGAYFAITQIFSWSVIIYSLPISFLIPALMLSNEMRDYTRDQRLSLGTLSVRKGHVVSRNLYGILILATYGVTLGLILLGALTPWAFSLFFTLPLAKKAYSSVSRFEGLGIPNTNRLHLVFSCAYLAMLALSS